MLVDCLHFSFQVHERSDTRIAESVRGRPCVVVQYNDVICANAAAKAAGVRKHQRPQEARRRIAPDGRLLHAFWRKWPGPRVSYTPYQATSRAVFDSITGFLRAHSEGSPFVLERTSIDEVVPDRPTWL